MWVGPPDGWVSLGAGELGVPPPPAFIEPVIFLHGRGIRETPGRIPQHYGATHCRQREYKRTDTGRAPGGLGSPLLEPLINFSATYFIDRQTRRCFLLPDM